MQPPPDHGERASSLSVLTMADVVLSTDLLEALPDAIVAVDTDGTMVQVNSQAQELFGYAREELIGQKVEMRVPNSFRAHPPPHGKIFPKAPGRGQRGGV